MKRIAQYRKLFDAVESTTLKELKTTYRNLVKEWHPDKFQEDDSKFAEAKLKSQEIIDGYHFLVSIAPETRASSLEEYTETINTGIYDFKHKGVLLEITYLNGDTYEYFGVSKNVYIKLINAGHQNRFAKRNICNSFLYRKSKSENLDAANS
jgi:dimeric dUTPase (all-alpha-NTP-PPase superfamily)